MPQTEGCRSGAHGRCTGRLHDRAGSERAVGQPDLGIGEPLAAVAERYNLDREALLEAAQSALAAPDRVVGLEVAARTPP